MNTPPSKRTVLALGYQAADGTISVTEVLTANFPPLTQDELGHLSRKLDEWCRIHRRPGLSEHDTPQDTLDNVPQSPAQSRPVHAELA